jgi:hypothetical protein
MLFESAVADDSFLQFPLLYQRWWKRLRELSFVFSFFDSMLPFHRFVLLGFCVSTCVCPSPWETGKKVEGCTTPTKVSDLTRATSAQVPKSNGRTGSI